MTTQNAYGAVDLSSLVKPKGGAPAGEARGVVKNVTEADFQQLVQQSMTVPVVIDLWAEWCQPCKQLGPILEKLAVEYGGRFLLAKIDVEANQQLAAAFQVQSIPNVVALLGGQPVPLFQGAYPEAQIRQILDQLLQVAAQNGITGTVELKEAPPEPVNPEHAAAAALVAARDWEQARAAYQHILDEAPADEEAKVALAMVNVHLRLGESDPQATLAAAIAGDADSELAAADAAMVLGRYDDAFALALAVIREGGEAKETARVRLLEYFEIAGNDYAGVSAARRQLASALY